MNLIAQASEGLSLFLHPDYVSAANRPKPEIYFFNGLITQDELFLIVNLIATFLIAGILIAYLINVIKKRTYSRKR